MSMVMTGSAELEKKSRELMSGGTLGKKIFRKGLRAGAKVIAVRVKATFPRKSGLAAASVKVKAIKRSRSRIGVRVSLFAVSKAGFPYPYGLEGGTKNQPRGGRVRKSVREGQAYSALTWHVEPQHNVKKAFDASAGEALQAISATWASELEKVKP